MSARDMDPLECPLSAEETYHPGLHVLMQTAAEKYLHTSMLTWRQQESKRNKHLGLHHSVVYDSGENPLLAIGLSVSTILWLSRQSNLIHSAEDMSRVVATVNAYGNGLIEDAEDHHALQQHTSPHVHLVTITRVPSLICSIGGLIMQHRQHRLDAAIFPPTSTLTASNLIHRPDASHPYLQSLVGSSELSSEASAISLTCPGILFASCLPVPAVLQELYCPKSEETLRVKSCVVGNIMRFLNLENAQQEVPSSSAAAVTATAIDDANDKKESGDVLFDYSNMAGYDEEKFLPFHQVVELFKRSGLIPLMTTVDLIESAACGVLDRTVFYEPNPYRRKGRGNLLSQREVIEVLFNVSQVLYGGAAESFTAGHMSIELHREVLSEDKYLWTTGPRVTIPYSFGRQVPKLCVAEHVDRLYCLLDICDPTCWDVPVMERLHISTTNDTPTPESLVTRSSAGEATCPPPSPSRYHLTKSKDSMTISEHAMTGYMEAFSSTVGGMLNTLLTNVNIYKFKHADIHKIPGPEELSFVQQVLVLLFIHFPVNDLALNPWDLGDIISQSTMADDAYIEDSKRDYIRLQLDMRYICTRFNMTSHMLEAYLAHILQFELESVYKDESPIAVTLNSPFSKLLPHLENLLSFSSLQLLREGQNMLAWEFLRCARYNFRNAFTQASTDSPGHQNPFLKDVICPFPTHHIFVHRNRELTISRRGMKSWVAVHALDEEYCNVLFNALTTILDMPCLTYSCFVVFAVLSYNSRNGHSTSREDFVTSTRSLLDRINRDMNKTQKLLCHSINSLGMGEVLGSSVTTEATQAAFAEAVACALTRYKALCDTDTTKALVSTDKPATLQEPPPRDMPPRPPLSLLDAPRFLHLCKCLGILGTVTSISSVWASFSRAVEEAYLPSQRQGWDPSVVPPLPLQLNTQTVDRVLSFMHVGRVQDVTDELKPLSSAQSILLTSLVPWLLGNADDLVATAALAGDSMQAITLISPPGNDRNPPLDDILRYGGHRVIAALDRFYPWVVDAYGFLAQKDYFVNEGTHEPLLRNVCQFLSKAKIFSLGALSVLMKASICPRVRGCPPLLPAYVKSGRNGQSSHQVEQQPQQLLSQLASSGHDVGVSLPEFEELIIRCAYALWRKTGVGNMQKIAGADIYRLVQAALPLVEEKGVSEYCERCRTSLMQSRNNAPVEKYRYEQAGVESPGIRRDFRVTTRPGGKTWGVDFLQPFCSLMEVTIDIAKEREYVDTQNAERRHTTVKLPCTTPTKENTDKVITKKEGASTCASDGVSETSSPVRESVGTSRRSTPDDDGVYNILQSVGTKSEQALSNILALRDAAVAASRDSADENTPYDEDVTAGNGAPEGKHSHLPTALASDPSSSRVEIANTSRITISTPRPECPLGGAPASIEPLKHMTPIEPLPGQNPTPVASPSRHVRSLADRRHTPSPHRLHNIRILEGTKEVLWPVFATYCSCGDSSDPGKLSGPNLFALLSKLDLLTNDTTIPDLGILLHQISAHSLAQSFAVVSSLKNKKADDDMTPLLSFEEFLVFLCVFAELRCNGTVNIPLLSKDSLAFAKPQSSDKTIGDPADSPSLEDWFDVWSDFMTTSATFRRLLEECVLPPLQKSLVLASPEDARHRDEFCLLFSLEIMFSIAAIDKNMLLLYHADQLELQRTPPGGRDPIVIALRRIKIVPNIISEDEVMQLIADILPKSALQRARSTAGSFPYRRTFMCYPQWQWVICVVALKAVVVSLRMNKYQSQDRVSVSC